MYKSAILTACRIVAEVKESVNVRRLHLIKRLMIELEILLYLNHPVDEHCTHLHVQLMRLRHVVVDDELLLREKVDVSSNET